MRRCVGSRYASSSFWRRAETSPPTSARAAGLKSSAASSSTNCVTISPRVSKNAGPRISCTPKNCASVPLAGSVWACHRRLPGASARLCFRRKREKPLRRRWAPRRRAFAVVGVPRSSPPRRDETTGGSVLAVDRHLTGDREGLRIHARHNVCAFDPRITRAIHKQPRPVLTRRDLMLRATLVDSPSLLPFHADILCATALSSLPSGALPILRGGGREGLFSTNGNSRRCRLSARSAA